MSNPVPPGQPDQGLHDESPDQGLHDESPDQGLHDVTPAQKVDAPAPKSKTPIFVGVGAAILVLIGIIAAIFH